MCKEATHVKRHLWTKQLTVGPTQVLENRALSVAHPVSSALAAQRWQSLSARATPCQWPVTCAQSQSYGVHILTHQALICFTTASEALGWLHICRLKIIRNLNLEILALMIWQIRRGNARRSQVSWPHRYGSLSRLKLTVDTLISVAKGDKIAGNGILLTNEMMILTSITSMRSN